MDIEDNIKVVRLIDIYGQLLTKKQLDIITSYYFDNLTLSEIGDNFNISRQAVNDCINQSVKLIKGYESKLNFLIKLENAEKDLHSLSKQVGDKNLTQKIAKIISDLRS